MNEQDFYDSFLSADPVASNPFVNAERRSMGEPKKDSFLENKNVRYVMIGFLVLLVVLVLGAIGYKMFKSQDRAFANFGGYNAKVEQQYGSGGSASGNGSNFKYTGGYNTKDGYENKESASRVEDSWQNVLQNNNTVKFTAKFDGKTPGKEIVHLMQVKNSSGTPSITLGQKEGNWAIKREGGNSTLIKDKNGKPIKLSATTPVNAELRNEGGKVALYVNGVKQGTTDGKINDNSILKTGIYSSNKTQSFGKDQTVSSYLNGVSVGGGSSSSGSGGTTKTTKSSSSSKTSSSSKPSSSSSGGCGPKGTAKACPSGYSCQGGKKCVKN